MKKKNVMMRCVALSVCLMFSWVPASAQSIPEPRAVCAYCDTPVPNGVHGPKCPYSTGSSKGSGSHGGKSGHSSPDMNAMISGMIFQSLLTSMLTPNTGTGANHQQDILAAQQAAAMAAAQRALAMQRAEEAAFMAQHNKMMQAYKQPGGSPGMAFKSLSDSALAYKSLDDAEALAANARQPFDAPSEQTSDPNGLTLPEATPFFGDTMPLEDIQLLVNPENDPRVVDLRNANSYLVQNLKEEAGSAAGSRPPAARDNGEPIVDKPDCVKLARQMKGYVDQRKKFQKTIALAQQQVDAWQTANRNALVNAAKDGIDYFAGQLLEGMTNRGKAADRLEQIYRSNAEKMIKDGINIAEIEAKINQMRILSSAGKMAELTGNINDWSTFLEDGVADLIAQLSSSNHEIEQMLEDPKMRDYFQAESPELKALLDITKIAASNAVFGKWVARKIPIVAGIELAINQSYNAMDWLLSFNRIVEANKINGKVHDAAKRIQQNIDDSAFALRGCS